jgi:hypothetical protein
MSTRKTCSSNMNKRMGLLDLPQKRRTPAEKKADDELVANARAEREATSSQALQKIGELEEKMKTEQTATKVSVAKPIRPAAKNSKYMHTRCWTA